MVVKEGQSLSGQGQLASYKKPASVAFLGALPKTPFRGKVLKRELRELRELFSLKS